MQKLTTILRHKIPHLFHPQKKQQNLMKVELLLCNIINFLNGPRESGQWYYFMWLIKDQSIKLGIALARLADTSLNLDSLLIQLQDKVTEKWHQFGAALGVEKEILYRCLKYPPEQSIVEMLDHWLRSYDCEKRSWKEVARALRQIEHHQLAKEIESIDKTGHDHDGDNLCEKTSVIKYT